MILSYAAGHLEAFVEDLAGNPRGVEQRMRASVDALRAAGETGYLSTSAATLADALFDQGRYDEALEATRLSEETSAPDDVASQAQWRGVRARVHAARGQIEEAEALGREALAISEKTDHLNQIGFARMGFAEVLHVAGRREEAAAHAGKALEAFERKGNVVWAGQARRFLEELTSEG
jgi:tetratricopeptide (TPR) repeat protein